jgi:transposase InsO family protein
MDLYSRKIIGWHLNDNMKEALIIAAFKKALMNRTVTKELIVHSDRGDQYAGDKFRKLLHSKPPVLQSMSRADNPYDNAFMKSCFSRFKTELLQDGAFQNLQQDAHTKIFEYIEMYYNTARRHSSLNYQSPGNFENNYYFYKTQPTTLSAFFDTPQYSISSSQMTLLIIGFVYLLPFLKSCHAQPIKSVA